MKCQSYLKASAEKSTEFIKVATRQIPAVLTRNLRARRYILRFCADGCLRITIPCGGSVSEARRFASRNKAWLERQLIDFDRRGMGTKKWWIGREFLFRGALVRIDADGSRGGARVCLGTEILRFPGPDSDVRQAVEHRLRQIAELELSKRVFELSRTHNLNDVCRVTIRNQQSRWGSCSHQRNISLNWRLIQAPTFVQDYVVTHELMHLREMNHSAKFWAEVKRACPDYKAAERWLRANIVLIS